MNIIDSLKAKAFSALNNCDVCLRTDSTRENAISWYGEAVGIIKVIYTLFGQYVDTTSLAKRRDELEDRIWPGQAL